MALSNPILAAVEASSKQNIATGKVVESNTETLQSLQQGATEAAAEVSIADQLIFMTERNAQLQTQLDNQAVFKAAGGAEGQVLMMQELIGAQNKLNDLSDQRDDILDDEITGIGIIDAVINDLRASGTETEMVSAQREINLASTNIQQVTQAQESFNSANIINAEVVTKGTIEAGKKRVADLAVVDAANAEMAGIRQSTANMLALTQLKSAQVNQLLQVQSLENQQVEAIYRKKTRDLAQDTIDIQTVAANRYFVSRGLPEKTTGQVAHGLATNPKRWATIMRMGSVPGDQVMYGANVAEVQANNREGDPDALGVPNETSSMLDSEERAMWEEMTAADDVPRNQEEINAKFITRINNKMNVWEAEIIQGDHSNLFNAPRGMDAITGNEAVQKSALWQKVLEPKQMQEFNTQTFYDAALANMQVPGGISVEDAAQGIVELHKAAALHNSTLDGGFIRYGMRNQETYNARIDIPPSPFEQLVTTTALGGRAFEAGQEFNRPIERSKLINHMDVTEVMEVLNLIRTRTPKTPRIAEGEQ